METNLEFLQCAFLVVLLNPNLYQQLQEVLCDEINDCSKYDQGVDILNHIKKSVNWESLTGPEEVDKQILDSIKMSLYNKLTSYRTHGNLNG